MKKLSIIYEDSDILVVDKPQGIVMHPFDFSDEETLLDLVLKHAPSVGTIDNVKKLQDGRTVNLGGIVHKLDRDTSGVVIFAKNKSTFDDLSRQFKDHTVKKKYIALVEGVVQKKTFFIDAPLAREKKSYKQSVNPAEYRGQLRTAKTRVEVLEYRDGGTLVALYPETGRTHQLRAHMAYVGHPIIGDVIYGTDKKSSLTLHAQEITLTTAGKQITVTSLEKPF